MANVIGRSQNLVKNIKRPGDINNPSNATSSTSNKHDNFNENIDIASKDSLPAEISNSSVQNTTDNPIVTQPVSIPHSRYMLDNNFIVGDDSQMSENSRVNNHDATTTCAQVLFKYDQLQYQHNNKTHRPG